MKAFLERHDLVLSVGLAVLLDLLVLVAAPVHFLALLPLLCFQGVLLLLKYRFGDTWTALRRALYFYYIAFSYITFLLIGALMLGENVALPLMVVYYILALALVGFNLGVRILIRKERPAFKAPKVIQVVWEWFDAILWSLIMVAVVNTFVFQIYIIPSESMVPNYHIGDRPLVMKALSGPTIPLTQIKLPRIYIPKRGDVVVVKNTRPQYDHTLSGEASRFLNDLLFMSTFTMVNLNVDKRGDPLADPLVKRVIATEGDRLAMVDDQIWVQHAEGAEWVKADWAPYKPVKPDPRVREVPLTPETKTLLDAQDQEINALDIADWYAKTAARMDALKVRLKAKPWLKSGPASFDYKAVDLHNLDQDGFKALLSGLVWQIQNLGGKTPSADAGDALAFWLRQPVLTGTETYWLKCLRTELYFKGKLLDLVEMLVESDGSEASSKKVSDAALDWQNRMVALFGYRDSYGYIREDNFESRNLEPFPLDRRLGKDEYLAMGDNRYNSLDNRHFSSVPVLRRLVKNHEYSFNYWGINNPYTIKIDDILGFPLFKVWPWG